MPFKEYKDELPTSNLIYFGSPMNSAKLETPAKQPKSKWVVGLLFALVGFCLLVWEIIRIPARPQAIPIRPEVTPAPKVTPALKAAYDILVNHTRAINGSDWNVVLVGHDPCSAGISEGLRADAPWAHDLWISTINASGGDRNKLEQMHRNATAPKQMSNWDWAIRIINDNSTNVQVSDLWADNRPFYVTDREKDTFPVEVQEAVALWDNLQVRAYINEYFVASWTQNNTEECPPATEHQRILHTIGFINNNETAMLKSWGYGFPYDKDWPEMQVYGSNCGTVVTPIVEKIIGRAADKVADGILCSAICAGGDIVLFGPADPLADVGAGVCELECPEGVELGITLYDTCSKIPGTPCRSPAEYIATNVCKKLEEAAADAEAAAKQAAADAEAAAEAAAKQAAADAEAAAEATAKQIAADAEIAKCVLCAYLCC